MQGFAVSMSHYTGSIFTADSLLHPDYRQYVARTTKFAFSGSRCSDKVAVIYSQAAERQELAAAFGEHCSYFSFA
jgi:hypothetical protein